MSVTDVFFHFLENICLSQTWFFIFWKIYVCHRRVFSRFGKYMSVTDVFFPSLANICLSQTCFSKFGKYMSVTDVFFHVAFSSVFTAVLVLRGRS